MCGNFNILEFFKLGFLYLNNFIILEIFYSEYFLPRKFYTVRNFIFLRFFNHPLIFLSLLFIFYRYVKIFKYIFQWFVSTRDLLSHKLITFRFKKHGSELLWRKNKILFKATIRFKSHKGNSNSLVTFKTRSTKLKKINLLLFCKKRIVKIRKNVYWGVVVSQYSIYMLKIKKKNFVLETNKDKMNTKDYHISRLFLINSR